MDKHDPYSALRLPNYRRYAIGRLASGLGMQMQSVAIGWQLYNRTGSTMSLALVGLFQALPIIFFALPAGQIADRFERKKIVYLGYTVMALCSLCLAWLAFNHGPTLYIYICICIASVARAFSAPAGMSLLPQIVPVQSFPNAVTWNSTGFELASVLGPATAGFIIAGFGNGTVYCINALFSMICIFLFLQIEVHPTPFSTERVSFKTMAAGARFVWNSKVILAAITLDMFAVLLGGATTLLPVYAKDILHVGPTGLGWLRAAPSLGAITMAMFIAHSKPFQSAGKTLLWAVSGFGVATIIFGLSKSFALSLIMLFLLGSFDNISVVIRHTLIQVLTPDSMRGRVNAVNSVFIGSSNELGGFESGFVATFLGPIFSVVSGGIGTLVVVILAAWRWPELRKLKSLQSVSENSLISASPLAKP